MHTYGYFICGKKSYFFLLESQVKCVGAVFVDLEQVELEAGWAVHREVRLVLTSKHIRHRYFSAELVVRKIKDNG